MTGQQIHNVLEDAVDFYLDPSGSWGAYPRASGLRFDVNEGLSKGSRISNLEVNPKLADSWTTIEMDKTYSVVTNNFIAGVRDGYYEFGNIPADLKVDSYVEYAQSFIEYAQEVKVLSPVSEEDASTQNWFDQVDATMSPTESPLSFITPIPSQITTTSPTMNPTVSPSIKPVSFLNPTASPSTSKKGKKGKKTKKNIKPKSKASKMPK